MNGIFYVLRGGIPWRFLPKDFPPWQTVYYYLWVWRREGVVERGYDGGKKVKGRKRHLLVDT
jgi:putative transposase